MTPPQTGWGGTDTSTADNGQVEYTRENYPDSLPKDLDFGGKTVRISVWGADEAAPYETGGEEETGDVVFDAVYRRDRKVEDQLNVKLEYIYGDSSSTKYSESFYNTIMAGDAVYDIIQGYHSRAITYSHEGIWYNLFDAPYIDYDMPWWNVKYMDEISVAPQVRYLLMGDITVSCLRNQSCIYYNKTIYENLYGDGDALYDLVLDGKWTHDEMAKMCADAYQDTNGNGSVDFTDTLGAVLSSAAPSQGYHYAYNAGFKLNERTSDGYPSLIADQSRNVEIMESLNKLIHETKGVLYGGNDLTETVMQGKFPTGTILFSNQRLSAADSFRDMKDPYGIIPYPKVDEQQKNYISLVHNSGTLYGIPITLSDISMSCAVLEALCAETYRTVTPAYYDVALKVKYSQDETSGQTIDMIHDATTTDFFYANSASLNSIGVLPQEIVKVHDGNYMSTFESKKETVKTLLAAMIENAEK